MSDKRQQEYEVLKTHAAEERKHGRAHIAKAFGYPAPAESDNQNDDSGGKNDGE